MHAAISGSSPSTSATKPPWEAIPTPDFSDEQLSIQLAPHVGRSGQPESSLVETPPLWTLSAYETAQTDVNYTSLLPVAGGNLYLFDNVDRVRAIDLRTGRPHWHGTVALLSPLQAKDGIVAGVGREGGVYVFRARDGEMMWHRTLRHRVSWMSLIDDTLVTHDLDKGFEGYDAATGARRWSILKPGSNPDRAPTRRGDVLFIPGTPADPRPNTTVYALDFRRGELLWTAQSVDVPAGFAARSAYMLSNVVVGDIHRHRAIHIDVRSLSDGNPRGVLRLNPDPWSNANIPQTMYTQIRVTDQAIYISMGDNFYRYDRSEAPEEQRPLQTSTVGETFVAGPLNDWYYFSDPVGMVLVRFEGAHVEKLEIPLDGAQIGGLLVFGDTAFFGTTGGRIYGLQLESHKLSMRTSRVCWQPSVLTQDSGVLVAYCIGPDKTAGWPRVLAFRIP